MELIIISGRSGSGKSVALRALEDSGYYCVDNIPLPLIPQLATLLAERNQSVAVSLDIRNLPNKSGLLDDMLAQLPQDIQTKIIFLDCETSVLIRRYSDSRRSHPLSNEEGISLESAIELEGKWLDPLFQHANHIIDTTHLSSHGLAEKLRELLRGNSDKELKIIFESFGFKYGLPADADYVFDVRFLPNPHWNAELRPMTGLEQPVIDFLEAHSEVHNFIYQTRQYLEMWLPMLEKNNRSYLTIAIGCTGGKHRSVFITEQLGKYFQGKGKDVQIRHKSLEKYKKADH
ncbi:RNase adaptor protein RapZ [Pasteurellaceae bacterium RH1A]|nr:RNase adaptor protein RapZ [Pasteurellaceae bacterium RH1A]